MKQDNYLDVFDTNKEKAIQHAIWLNFKYRIAKIHFGVIEYPDNKWAVGEEATRDEIGISFLKTTQDHSYMSFDEIRHIKMDNDPLPHWEELIGAFSIMDGELLRFILYANIPLEKLIRYELATRGYDENHRWCGYEKSEEIWLKNN